MGKDNPAAVRVAREIRLADHAPALRGCLRCGRRFASRGPGNRICTPCANKGASLSRAEENAVRDPKGGAH